MPQARHATDGRRDTYHHGDLHHALVMAGLDLARTGGPDAVVLREATRRTGVSPNAAYRHFNGREALLDEVAVRATGYLTDAMNEAVVRARVEFANAEPKVRTTEVILAACRGYIDFALDEPGWFGVCASISDCSVETYVRHTSAGRSNGATDVAERPTMVPEVLRSVLQLPEPLSWAPDVTVDDFEVVLRSTLYGFSMLATTATMRVDDQSRRAGQVLSQLRTWIFHSIQK